MTLNIKTGDWAVFPRGDCDGPLNVTSDGVMETVSLENGMVNETGDYVEWAIDGTPVFDGEEYRIIATLPCSPIERIRQLETEMEKAKGELQALSSYLGAGMGNDDDPVSRFVERIKFGVDEFSNGLERIAEDRANRVRQLEEVLRFYANPEVYKPYPHGPAFDRRDISETARRALGESK